MSVSEHLQELREVFRDEVKDLAEVLERALAVLSRANVTDEDRRVAMATVYRVVHSLKGAARAVDVTTLERLMHAAEARLGPARVGALEIAPEVLRIGGLLLAVIRSTLPDLDALRDADAAVIATALRRVENDVRDPVSAIAVERASESPPIEPRSETVRVGAQRLDEIVSASEEVLGLSARLDTRLKADPLEALLADLQRDLARARSELRAARDPAVLAGLIDRALNGAHTAVVRARDGRARNTSELAALRAGVSHLIERGRTLRLAHLTNLRPALERMAYEVAGALGKQVELVFALDEIEVDRRVVDALRDPLMHLVRNAVDHGVEAPAARVRVGKPEAAKLEVRAVLRGRDVELSIADDGAGIDVQALIAAARRDGHEAGDGDALDLAFLPGVTTRAEASELSGRGMGLDIVRQRIAELHGRITLHSTPGRGTTFVLSVPLDLRVLHVMHVRVRDLEIGIVTSSIERLIRISPEQIVYLEGRMHLELGGAVVPLADLAEVLGVAARPVASRGEPDAKRNCVVVAVGERRIALVVDALLDDREVIAKPLGRRVVRAPFVSAASILPDGDVALILDTADLVRAAKPTARAAALANDRRTIRVLVVDDSVTTRQLERTILEAAGYEVVLAHDGQHAWELLSADAASFDAVVSDIEMPRMDGFALVSRIRATASTSRLPIVLVTALSQDEDRRRALELGASAYVVKSRFDQEQLIETLEGLV